ncbi:MAG: hypothetical protein ACKPKO_08045 [Candidatus Fonsibacter sp.]
MMEHKRTSWRIHTKMRTRMKEDEDKDEDEEDEEDSAMMSWVICRQLTLAHWCGLK